jgi:hypothetical protein
LIKIRYADLPAGLHVRAEAAGRHTVIYLLPGLTAAQRRAALSRTRSSARIGHGPALPAAELVCAITADRVRAIGRDVVAVLRAHPAIFIPPMIIAVSASLAYVLLATVSIRIPPPRSGGPLPHVVEPAQPGTGVLHARTPARPGGNASRVTQPGTPAVGAPGGTHRQRHGKRLRPIPTRGAPSPSPSRSASPSPAGSASPSPSLSPSPYPSLSPSPSPRPSDRPSPSPVPSLSLSPSPDPPPSSGPATSSGGACLTVGPLQVCIKL